MIYLKDGIECNLGKWSRMASSCKVGEVVYIDGFLKHCDDNKVLLEPAILRYPTAKFIPTKAEVKRDWDIPQTRRQDGCRIES